RVALLRVVANRARHLDHPVAAPDGLVQDVGLEVVAGEPVLVDVDRPIAEDVGLEDPEAVRRVGYATHDEDGEDDRIQPRAEDATDLPGLVQGGDDDGDDRLQCRRIVARDGACRQPPTSTNGGARGSAVRQAEPSRDALIARLTSSGVDTRTSSRATATSR